MQVDTSRLKQCIYQVELQLTKLNQLDSHQLTDHLPEQKQQAHTACVDLIEVLLVIVNELEKPESENE